MSYPTAFDIAANGATGWRSIKVEGRNTVVGQDFVPVTPNGTYRTPQVGGQVQLRIRSGGSTDDASDGTGAREVELYGLDENGLEITETVATNGALASDPTSRSFLRLMGTRVSKSGTYATQSAGSHAADINIESTAGVLWGTIPINGFPESTSRIGAFTIPANYEGFLIGIRINASAGKTVDAVLFKRENVLEVTPPYAPMEVVGEFFNVPNVLDVAYDAPIYFPPMTDLGIMAVIDVQTARVGSALGLLLRKAR